MLAARNAAAEVVAKAASATNSPAKGGKGIADKETIAAATKAAVVAAIVAVYMAGVRVFEVSTGQAIVDETGGADH